MNSALRKSKPIVFLLCLNDSGGAEISMIRLASGLRAKGYPVTLAVYGSRTDLAHKLGFEGEIEELGCARSVAALWPFHKVLRNGKFSYVISALSHTNVIALLATFLIPRRIAVYVTEHGIDVSDASHAFFAPSLITRFFYLRATSVIAVSKGLTDRWRHALPHWVRVQTIYNPVVDTVREHVPPPAHDWLGQSEVPTILGMGRLKDEKNFALLIRAFAQLRRNVPCRLVILGEGEERPSLILLVKTLGIGEWVLMPGFVDAPQSWLGHASLFVCPSKREGFGNALVEALASGVPVVSTDCPFGPSEILDRGRYGRLVPVNNVDALVGAMDEALRVRPDRDALQKRANEFSVARCIDDYSALLDNRQV